MPALDLRAVILLAGAMGALMSVVLWFLRRSYPPSIRGLGEWAAGPAIIFVSTLLFGARGVLPELLTVVVANLLLLSGVVLIYLGTARFLSITVNARRWWAGVILVTLFCTWFTYVQPIYNWRLLAVAAFMATVFAQHAIMVARYAGSAFSARFVLVVLMVETLVLSLRAASALVTESSELLQASPVQTLYITAYAVAMLMLTVGLVLLAADRLREELEHIASRDPLTGVLTRRTLLEACERELSRCRRHVRPMSLLMLDLDCFKAINDSHGHLVGDRVLLDFVARTEAQLRKVDRLGRYGGEEFLVLLPETGNDEARVVAERIRTALLVPHHLPPYTVSIGVASFLAADARVDDLLARADAALYRAKANGRNRVEADQPVPPTGSTAASG